MRAVIAVGLATSGLLAACSLLVSVDGQQCSVDSDCRLRGGAFANSVCSNQVCVAPPDVTVEASVEASAEAAVDTGAGDGDAGAPASDGAVDPWGCLAQPGEVLNASQMITVTLTAFDALQPIMTEGPTGSDLVPVSYTAVSGAQLEGCTVFDPSCQNVVASGALDDAGVITFQVPGNFVGFFRLTASGYLPATLYPGQLLADASTESLTAAMLGVGELDELAVALGVTLYTDPDAGVGQAFFEAYDCFDHLAPGVTFTVLGDAGPNTQQFYTLNGGPSTTSTQTDRLGTGGVVNVPIGGLSMVARLASSGRMLGTVNGIVRPGETLFGYVRVRTH
jgi:hypothetical protein